jgi:hypothetical protein
MLDVVSSKPRKNLSTSSRDALKGRPLSLTTDPSSGSLSSMGEGVAKCPLLDVLLLPPVSMLRCSMPIQCFAWAA